MPEIDLHAAAHVYLFTRRTANQNPRHPIPGHALAALQSTVALATAEEMWSALTGLTGQDAVDYAEELVRE